MHGICFDYDLQEWFDVKIPRTSIAADYIFNAVSEEEDISIKPSAKIVWLGGKGTGIPFVRSKKGNSWEMMALTFYDKKETFVIEVGQKEGEWLLVMLDNLSVRNIRTWTFAGVKEDYEKEMEDFELFWQGRAVGILRGFGLLVL